MNKRITQERIIVRYADTDMMGHVYYSNYLIYFEQARSAMFRERGVPYKEIEARGYKFPVVEAFVKYRGEVKYDDEVTVHAWVDEIKRASVKIAYEVHNATSGQITTTGYTWHVMVSAETFKATSIPDWLLELL
jgi:acyl-CoA thioester hydrolase